MKRLYSALFCSVLLISSCTNLENADPAQRKTFVKFYEGASSMTAASIEPTEKGYIILANVEQTVDANTLFFTVVFEVDDQGHRLGNFFSFPNGTGKSIKSLSNGGYVIVGDSISVQADAEQAANVTVSSLRTLIVNESFDLIRSFTLTDSNPNVNAIKEDFFGGAVTVAADGRIFILGTFKEGVVNQASAPEKQLLFVRNPDLSPNWSNDFDLADNTYQNAKSVHLSPSGQVVWATAIADIQGAFNRSWLAIPAVQDSAIYSNFSHFGQTTTQFMVPSDIQPAFNPSLGFGVVGTYSSQTDGSAGNMFFVRVRANGLIDPNTIRYFDGIDSFNGTVAVDAAQSSILDQGKAICSTKDGGFLVAGTLVTNPQKGNGGKDIFLVKVNTFGSPIWMKTLGGIGDEEVTAVRLAKDGGLIVCGTNTIGDYSSVFLMKLDENGNLEN